VDDVAPHVPHSELLLAAKAEGLARLGRLGRARELCEQAVHLDEAAASSARQAGASWRLWLQARCSWQEGDAEGKLKAQLEALATLLEKEVGAAEKDGGAGGNAGAGGAFFPPSPAGDVSNGASADERRRLEQLAVIVGMPSLEDVRQLLEGLAAADALRLAGNAAVKTGKAAEAVQKYTEALAGELPRLWLHSCNAGRPATSTVPSEHLSYGQLRFSAFNYVIVPHRCHAGGVPRSRLPIAVHRCGAAVQPCRGAPAPEAARSGGPPPHILWLVERPIRPWPWG
jgi:hypothetical protein